jgi:hypothetical protein
MLWIQKSMRHVCSTHQVRPVQMSRTAFSLIPYSRATTVAETRFLALPGEWRCESNGRDRRNISTASSLVRIARLFKLLRPELLHRDLSSSDPLGSDAARSQFGSSIDIARGTSKEFRRKNHLRRNGLQFQYLKTFSFVRITAKSARPRACFMT